ncbi:MAG TPA: cyclic nucleotide-binding domain-containing protein [Thermoanaerobaculia bacterium]
MQREFLRTIPLFRDLDPEQLARIEAVIHEQRVPANHVLFREGDPVDAFYIVRQGGITLFRDARGKAMQPLARLGEGGFFGEMGLLTRSLRQASARTSSPTILLRIDKGDLLNLLAQNPTLELKLRAEIIQRHGMNVSSLLGLAGQRDVRFRLGVAAELEVAPGERVAVTLENLSLGGVALSGMPSGWESKHEVEFGLARPGEPPLLAVRGIVSWREGDTVGIAFDPGVIGDGAPIHRALRKFLDGK